VTAFLSITIKRCKGVRIMYIIGDGVLPPQNDEYSQDIQKILKYFNNEYKYDTQTDLKRFNDEYEHNTQTVLEYTYNTLQTFQDTAKSLKKQSDEVSNLIKKYLEKYILNKVPLSKIKKSIDEISPEKTYIIATKNLIIEILTALKRFTGATRVYLDKNRETMSNEDREKIEILRELAKALKKILIAYLNYYLGTDGILCVPNTRIFQLDQDGIPLPVKTRKSSNKKLFPHGYPHVDDIHQQVGHANCYLMSTLKSIVRTNYRAIEACFYYYQIDDKRVTIILYKVTVDCVKCNDDTVWITANEKIAVIVDNTPLYPNAKSARWVYLIEKAIIAMCTKAGLLTKLGFNSLLEKGHDNHNKPPPTNKLGNLIYNRLDQYNSALVTAAITGKSTLLTFDAGDAPDNVYSIPLKRKNNVQQIIDAILDDNIAVTVGSTDRAPSGVTPPRNWLTSHLYCVDAFKNGYFILSDAKSKEKLQIKEKDFLKLFDQATFGEFS
jgi:hypothetical protein